MSKRVTTIAASVLALSLVGCEQRTRQETEEESRLEGVREERGEALERERTEEQRTRGEMARIEPGATQRGQPTHMEQPGHRRPLGEIVSIQSQQSFDGTLSSITRQMREHELEVIGTLRYDREMRERMMREQTGQPMEQTGQPMEQPGAMGRQPPGQAMGAGIGNARLLVFRRPDVEARLLEQHGVESLLDAPRQVLVYEKNEQVFVTYRGGEQPAIEGVEPTFDMLRTIVEQATQPQQAIARGRAERGRTSPY